MYIYPWLTVDQHWVPPSLPPPLLVRALIGRSVRLVHSVTVGWGSYILEVRLT